MAAPDLATALVSPSAITRSQALAWVQRQVQLPPSRDAWQAASDYVCDAVVKNSQYPPRLVLDLLELVVPFWLADRPDAIDGVPRLVLRALQHIDVRRGDARLVEPLCWLWVVCEAAPPDSPLKPDANEQKSWATRLAQSPASVMALSQAYLRLLRHGDAHPAEAVAGAGAETATGAEEETELEDWADDSAMLPEGTALRHSQILRFVEVHVSQGLAGHPNAAYLSEAMWSSLTTLSDALAAVAREAPASPPTAEGPDATPLGVRLVQLWFRLLDTMMPLWAHRGWRLGERIPESRYRWLLHRLRDDVAALATQPATPATVFSGFLRRCYEISAAWGCLATELPMRVPPAPPSLRSAVAKPDRTGSAASSSSRLMCDQPQVGRTVLAWLFSGKRPSALAVCIARADAAVREAHAASTRLLASFLLIQISVTGSASLFTTVRPSMIARLVSAVTRAAARLAPDAPDASVSATDWLAAFALLTDQLATGRAAVTDDALLARVLAARRAAPATRDTVAWPAAALAGPAQLMAAAVDGLARDGAIVALSCDAPGVLSDRSPAAFGWVHLGAQLCDPTRLAARDTTWLVPLRPLVAQHLEAAVALVRWSHEHLAAARPAGRGRDAARACLGAVHLELLLHSGTATLARAFLDDEFRRGHVLANKGPKLAEADATALIGIMHTMDRVVDVHPSAWVLAQAFLDMISRVLQENLRRLSRHHMTAVWERLIIALLDCLAERVLSRESTQAADALLLCLRFIDEWPSHLITPSAGERLERVVVRSLEARVSTGQSLYLSFLKAWSARMLDNKFIDAAQTALIGRLMLHVAHDCGREVTAKTVEEDDTLPVYAQELLTQWVLPHIHPTATATTSTDDVTSHETVAVTASAESRLMRPLALRALLAFPSFHHADVAVDAEGMTERRARLPDAAAVRGPLGLAPLANALPATRNASLDPTADEDSDAWAAYWAASVDWEIAHMPRSVYIHQAALPATAPAAMTMGAAGSSHPATPSITQQPVGPVDLMRVLSQWKDDCFPGQREGAMFLLLWQSTPLVASLPTRAIADADEALQAFSPLMDLAQELLRNASGLMEIGLPMRTGGLATIHQAFWESILAALAFHPWQSHKEAILTMLIDRMAGRISHVKEEADLVDLSSPSVVSYAGLVHAALMSRETPLDLFFHIEEAVHRIHALLTVWLASPWTATDATGHDLVHALLLLMPHFTAHDSVLVVSVIRVLERCAAQVDASQFVWTVAAATEGLYAMYYGPARAELGLDAHDTPTLTSLAVRATSTVPCLLGFALGACHDAALVDAITQHLSAADEAPAPGDPVGDAPSLSPTPTPEAVPETLAALLAGLVRQLPRYVVDGHVVVPVNAYARAQLLSALLLAVEVADRLGHDGLAAHPVLGPLAAQRAVWRSTVVAGFLGVELTQAVALWTTAFAQVESAFQRQLYIEHPRDPDVKIASARLLASAVRSLHPAAVAQPSKSKSKSLLDAVWQCVVKEREPALKKMGCWVYGLLLHGYAHPAARVPRASSALLSARASGDMPAGGDVPARLDRLDVVLSPSRHLWDALCTALSPEAAPPSMGTTAWLLAVLSQIERPLPVVSGLPLCTVPPRFWGVLREDPVRWVQWSTFLRRQVNPRSDFAWHNALVMNLHEMAKQQQGPRGLPACLEAEIHTTFDVLMRSVGIVAAAQPRADHANLPGRRTAPFVRITTLAEALSGLLAILLAEPTSPALVRFLTWLGTRCRATSSGAADRYMTQASAIGIYGPLLETWERAPCASVADIRRLVAFKPCFVHASDLHKTLFAASETASTAPLSPKAMLGRAMLLPTLEKHRMADEEPSASHLVPVLQGVVTLLASSSSSSSSPASSASDVSSPSSLSNESAAYLAAVVLEQLTAFRSREALGGELLTLVLVRCQHADWRGVATAWRLALQMWDMAPPHATEPTAPPVVSTAWLRGITANGLTLSLGGKVTHLCRELPRYPPCAPLLPACRELRRVLALFVETSYHVEDGALVFED
ncbi:hypothetical protein CXG81DRAFT_28176 [Caulochytrium protostelioides]|uniref:Uncharacterized protein n=1 Tax=Caulochytrium protostelioides TaxID=1555241 RepID=A0A4P9WZM7_9FUNG|nr:hypothetical protein CXG81DRAFT_28176 [Caulochytrium protostelioides]|eukprot:RKO99039.1 hypothetical protein CXG81DRAFT_28176 [Caulochytrium protostelioides]